jgi:thiol:disulfide interchange protein DsbA
METRPMKRTALLLSVLLLAACNQNAPAPADATAPATTPAATTPSAEAEAAAASAAASAGAQPADAGAATPAVDAAAAAAVDSITQASNNGQALVPGTDYEVIQGGQPYLPLNGKIEVVEVFGYVCPACAQFEPLATAWEQKLPADVRFSYVPAPFGPQWIPYAKAFYVAESMGLVGKTHTALFKAIHIDQTLPGEGKTPDEAAVAAFYGKYGADPKQFLAAMHSFAIDAKVKRGQQFMVRSGVGGTPTIVVDGKYRVLGKSYPDMLRITNQLIAQERAAQGTAAQQ